MQEVWNRPVRSHNAATVLCRKFKALRYALKNWSKTISRISVAIVNCNETLAQLDELENNRVLTIPEMNFRNILKKHLLRLLIYQNIYWKKRCTIRWVKFGDENTKFFQAVATERFRHNNIASFRNDAGETVDDHAEKEALLFQTYTACLGTSRPSEMRFNLPDIIQPHANLDQLTVPFTHAEIDEVIKDMPSDRAPVPDGFSGAFLKAC